MVSLLDHRFLDVTITIIIQRWTQHFSNAISDLCSYMCSSYSCVNVLFVDSLITDSALYLGKYVYVSMLVYHASEMQLTSVDVSVM